MSAINSFIKELQPNPFEVNMRARCIKTYFLNLSELGRQYYGMECLLQDEEGKYVHVTIPRSQAFRFASVLKDRKPYFIKDVVVFDNNLHFQPYTCAYKALFTSKTKLFEILDPNLCISRPLAMSLEQEIELSKDRFRTLGQLLQTRELGSFWTYCKIGAIDSKFDWYYQSCKRCPKNMTVVGDTLYCEDCDIFDPNGCVRYKLQVRAFDHSANASLILWDEDCCKLFGRSASFMLPKEESMVVPDAITNLVNFEALFKVQLKGGVLGVHIGPMSVLKFTTDMTLIRKYFDVKSCPDVFNKYTGWIESNPCKFMGRKEDDIAIPTHNSKFPNNEKTAVIGVKRSFVEELCNYEVDKKMKKIATEFDKKVKEAVQGIEFDLKKKVVEETDIGKKMKKDGEGGSCENKMKVVE